MTMHPTLKILIYTMLLAPISATAMELSQKRSKTEFQPDKIELNKQLAQAVYTCKGTRDEWIIIKKLIEEGADPNQTDNQGFTPLMAAAVTGNKEIAQVLIDAGADVNQKDDTGDHALIIAARFGHLEILTILINAGADLHHKNNDNGWNALMAAACEGHSQIITLLIAAGADLHQTDNQGMTALIIATEWHCNGYSTRKETIQLLIAAGADLHQTDNRGKSAFTIAVSKNYPKATCRMIVLAHLARIEQQKQNILTLLQCYKRKCRQEYLQIRDNFQTCFPPIFQEERRTLIDEINQIKDNDIKNELLALCNQMNTQNPQQDQ